MLHALDVNEPLTSPHNAVIQFVVVLFQGGDASTFASLSRSRTFYVYVFQPIRLDLSISKLQ